MRGTGRAFRLNEGKHENKSLDSELILPNPKSMPWAHLCGDSLLCGFRYVT